MIIFTDGACRENQKGCGIGGWAFVALEQVPGKDMKVVCQKSGNISGTTNQQMEIIAVTEALETVFDFYDGEVNLYSDSAYVINCMNDRWYDKWKSNGWMNSKKKPVENQESWERLLSSIEGKKINFFHVHRNSTKYIKFVDGLAKAESRVGESLDVPS
jgi:ribonuclease HI